MSRSKRRKKEDSNASRQGQSGDQCRGESVPSTRPSVAAQLAVVISVHPVQSGPAPETPRCVRSSRQSSRSICDRAGETPPRSCRPGLAKLSLPIHSSARSLDETERNFQVFPPFHNSNGWFAIQLGIETRLITRHHAKQKFAPPKPLKLRE